MTLAITPAQARALAALRVGLPETRLVVIGAAALGHYVPLTRATADIDLAIVLAPADLDRVLGPLGWQRDARMRQRWHGPEGVLVDLLPATDELVAAGEIRFDGDDLRMSLVGFDLALRHTTRVTLSVGDVDVELATLAVLVVLKMVAWLDRPHERTKDLGDLALIFDQALDGDDDRRWDPEHPVFQSGLEHEDQGAFFAGLEVARIVEREHRALIDTFLSRVGDPDGEAFSAMLRAARYGGDAPEDRLVRRLDAFGLGLARGQ